MALVASGVDNEVPNHGMAGQGLNTDTTTVLGQCADLNTVSENDTPVDTNTGGWCTGSPTSSEGQASVNFALHGDEEVLNGGVPGYRTGQRVPTGFGSLWAVAENLQRDGQFILFNDAWSKVALDNIVVIAGAVGLHFLKQFKLERSGFINTSQERKCLFNPNLPGRFKVDIAFLNGVGFRSTESSELVVPIMAGLAEFVVGRVANRTDGEMD